MCSDINYRIDRGFCHCGCGVPAPPAKKTAAKYGHAKGEPIRYIDGHYVYYERYRGLIPAGVHLDHLCRNRACVNPNHLEPVTAKEHAARRDRAKRKRGLRVLR